MEECLRLENHWLACMAAVGGGAAVTRTAGGVVVVNERVPGYAFNFMLLRGIQPGRLSAVTEIGGTLLAAGERPPAVFLSPAAGNVKALGAEFTDLGWRRLLKQAVLVRHLGPEPVPAGDDLPVRWVGPEDVMRWTETLVEAYEVDPWTAGNLADAWGSLLTTPGDGGQARGCLAWADGRPAGTGLVWIHGQTAGLYCGAVLPAFRRRGLHRATVLARLAAARAAGCTLALVQTEDGSPVERLCTDQMGFRVAYHRELWAPR